MMSAFLAQVFGDRPPAEKMIELKQQTSLQTETLLCGMRSDEKLALLGGRRGTRVLLDTSTMRIVDQSRYGANINGIALFAEDMAALGRIGLDLVPAIGKRATEHLGSYREHVAAVECMSNWGARSEGQIVTGSRDGILRCWTFVANLSQGTNLKVARQIQKLMAFGNELLVAAREELLLIDEDLEVVRRIPLNFEISDFQIVDEDTLIACGPGNVAHVNLAQGV